MDVGIFGIFIGVVFLLFLRWLWVVVFFASGWAACFSMLASIIHFKILAAVGFYFLMHICWRFAAEIAAAATVNGWMVGSNKGH